MPDLSCSVTHCKHNSDHLCILDSIKISGGNSKEGTCCESFVEAGTAENATNKSVEASAKTHVYCTANDCTFNDECDCRADGIDICKCSSNCSCHETECHSFTAK